MRKLMEDELRDAVIRVMDEGVQHRIGEPAQCGIGGHTTDVNVAAFGRQGRGEALGFLAGKISAVAHAPGDGKAPALRSHGKLWRRKHVPYHERTLEVSVPRVTTVVRQPEFLAGEAADLQHG